MARPPPEAGGGAPPARGGGGWRRPVDMASPSNNSGSSWSTGGGRGWPGLRSTGAYRKVCHTCILTIKLELYGKNEKLNSFPYPILLNNLYFPIWQTKLFKSSFTYIYMFIFLLLPPNIYSIIYIVN